MAKAKRKKRGQAKIQFKPLTAPSIDFHYIKSVFHRVIHVDGAHGGITPTGDRLSIALYNERHPIPTLEQYKLENGRQKDRVGVESRKGIVREVESTLIMDFDTAERIHSWLGERIKQHNDIAATLQKLKETKAE